MSFPLSPRRLGRRDRTNFNRRPSHFLPRLERLEERLAPATVFWNVDADGDWGVAGNWSTGTVPTSQDDVVLDRPAGVFNITLGNGTRLVRSLNSKENLILSGGFLSLATASQLDGNMMLSGATLDLGGDLTLNGGNNSWTSGTLQGSKTLSNLGALTLSGVGTKSLNAPLTNSGSVSVISGSLSVGSGSITNQSSGLVDLANDAALSMNGFNTFTNRGTMRKSSGGGTLAIAAGFRHEGGTIEVLSGTLALSGGGGSNFASSVGGIFNVSAGAILDLTGAGGNAATYTGTYTGTGTGAVRLNSGGITVGTGGATFNFPEGMFQWSGGVIRTGSDGLTNAGFITLAGASAKQLDGSAALINTGTIVVTGTGSWQFNAGGGTGRFDNRTGGLIDFQTNMKISNSAAASSNAGVIRKSAGSGAVDFDVLFNNQTGGVLKVDSGTLIIRVGTNTGGEFQVAAGAILEVATNAFGAGYTWTGTYTGSGAGAIRLTTCRIAVGAAGSTFNFPAGLLHWAGGFITGSFTNAGAISIDGASNFDAGTLTNKGTITFLTNGDLRLVIGSGIGRIDNLAGGLIDFQADTQIIASAVASSNAGTIRKSAGAGAANWNAKLDNQATGVFDVQSGTLTWSNVGTSTAGTFLVATGAIFDIVADAFGNSHTWTGVYTGSGGGTVRLTGRIQVGTGGASFHFPAGMFQWVGGIIRTGIGAALTNAGFITLSGTSVKQLDGSEPLINTGTIVITGAGDWQLNAGSGIGRFDNRAEGLIDFQTDARIVNSAVASKNAGIIRKSTGGGVASILETLDNTGTLEVLSGTLTVTALTQISGTTLIAGSYTVHNGAALTVTNGSNIAANQAQITLGKSGSTFAKINSLTSNSGRLSLADGRTFSTTGNLNNSGNIQVGAGSTLSVNGAYTQSAAGSLDIAIGGDPASGQFGRLNSSGNASLGGTLNINLVDGFGPSGGQDFTIMTFSSKTGNFAAVNGLTSGTLTLFTANLADTSLTLTAAISLTDLTVSDIVVPANGVAGQDTTIRYTITNRNSTPAVGSWTDVVYLSAEGTLGASDFVLGRVTHTGGVAGLGTYTETLSAPLPGVLPANYRVLIQTDDRRQVPDIDRTNNIGASSNSIAVDVTPLTISTAVNGTIKPGQKIYFRMTVPAIAELQITGAFASPNAAEVLLGFGSVPSGNVSDRLVFTPNSTEQNLSLFNPNPGTYFIALHGREGAAGGQAFTLVAAVPPFALKSIDVSLGANIGGVTVPLKGTGFLPSMEARLVGGGATHAAKSIHYISPEESTATFDLTGLELGLYDVQVAQANETQTLAGAFQVINGEPGRLKINVVMPSTVRNGRNFTAYIDYSNIGQTDLVAPLLFVSSPSKSLFNFDVTAEPIEPKAQALAVSDTAPAGVLRPGQSGRLPVRVKANGLTVEIKVDFVDASTKAPMDWESIRVDLEGAAAAKPHFEAIFQQLMAQVGPTWGDYVSMLAHNATLLPAEGSNNRDPFTLLMIEVNRAEAAVTTSISGRMNATDARVNISGVRMSASNTSSVASFTALTLNDGSFVFPNLTPGTYELHVDGARVIGTTPNPLTLVGGEHRVGVEVRTALGEVLVGTIRDSAGDFVPNAAVLLYANGAVVDETTTDSAGGFRLTELNSGTYDLVADVPEHARTQLDAVSVSGGFTEVAITMGAQATVSAKIVLPDGSPARDLVVAATRQGASALPLYYTFDEDGKFTLGGLPAGTYDLVFISGNVTKQALNVTVASGAAVDLGTIDPDTGLDLEASLLAAEAFLRTTWLPASFAKYGAVTQSLWQSYLGGTPDAQPDRQFFRDGSEIVEGAPQAVGFRHSANDSLFNNVNVGLIEARVLQDLKTMFQSGALTCEELVRTGAKTFSLDSFPSVIAGAIKSGGTQNLLILDTNYDRILEIPGNLAGGVGPKADPSHPNGADGQFFADRRFYTGHVTVVPDGSDTVNVHFFVDMNVHDTIDLVPGNLGTGLEQIFTVPMTLLELHDRAFDVPFVVKFADLRFGKRVLSLPTGHEDCDIPQQPDPPLQPGGRGGAPVVTARDPNDIVGPAGFGPQGFIALNQALPYTIHFENVPTATAPAQEVFITQQLDSDLDFSTFQLGDFGFGSQVISVPDGRTSFRTRVDDRAVSGLFVDVDATFNVQSGTLTWNFTSVDPVDGNLPDNALAGFLPANISDGQGEGFISYTIRPRPNLPTGVRLDAQASIVFDVNAPLHTPAIFHTVDAGSPTGSVGALPTYSPASFLVNWSGADDLGGAGVGVFDVLVSENDGLFTPFVTGTPATSATFTGSDGHTYRFMVIATDNVGHKSAIPATPQAQTRVDALSPTSNVAPLAAIQAGTSISLNWTGADNVGGAGLAGFDLFVSDNGGPFMAFVTNTTATSASFTGLSGHSYRFFSVAIDGVGNRQPPPDTAQASTRIGTSSVSDINVGGVRVGESPEIRVMDSATNSVKFTVFAFDPAFTGGVQVATGDVNGDGVSDVICGAGAGGGPNVRVIDGKLGTDVIGPLGSFFAFDSQFTGGVNVAAGDVNGDGFADVIVAAGAGGGPDVKVFSGKDGVLLRSFFAFDAQFTGGARIAAGDVNGDGFADLIVAAGPGGGPDVKAVNGKDGAVLLSFFAFDVEFHGGVNVSAGDISGDGLADIVVGAGPGGGPEVAVYQGFDGVQLQRFFAYDPAFASGVNVKAEDRTGDGKADIVTVSATTGDAERAFNGLTAELIDLSLAST